MIKHLISLALLFSFVFMINLGCEEDDPLGNVPEEIPTLDELSSCMPEENLDALMHFIDTMLVVPISDPSESSGAMPGLAWVSDMKTLGYELGYLICDVDSLTIILEAAEKYLTGEITEADLYSEIISFLTNFLTDNDWETVVDNGYLAIQNSTVQELNCIGNWTNDAVAYLSSSRGEAWFNERLEMLFEGVDASGLAVFFSSFVPSAFQDEEDVQAFFDAANESGMNLYKGIMEGIIANGKPQFIKILQGSSIPSETSYQSAVDELVSSINTQGIASFVNFITDLFDSLGTDGKLELAGYVDTIGIPGFQGLLMTLFEIDYCGSE